jgi:hypothetical protein
LPEVFVKIFGFKLKPLLQRSGYSYVRRKADKVIDTKAIFADGVALGRMLAMEDSKPKRRRKKKS